MRNFQQIAAGVDVAPLLHAIQRQSDLWNQFTVRTDHPKTAHSEVDDILVWFNDLNQGLDGIIDDRDVISFPAWEHLPQLRPILFDLMRAVGGVRLGRVIITRLAPGKAIAEHVDMGAPADWFERYHIGLQVLPGVLFHAGDETLQMRGGDVIWFNNKQLHSVVNNSADDRIVCIVDIRPG